MRFANSPSRTWIFAAAFDIIWVVFLLIRGTSGSFVLSVSVLYSIPFFYSGLHAHTRAKFKGVCKDFLIKLFLSHKVNTCVCVCMYGYITHTHTHTHTHMYLLYAIKTI